MWLIPFSELTEEQKEIVKMPANRHRLVIGVAGSGKTQILLHRTAFLTKNYYAPPDRYRIFVFTNVVKEYIKSAVKFLGLDEASVSTFDHWCRLFYQKHISENLPLKTVFYPDFERIRESVLAYLKSHKYGKKPLGFALVDEGQDLSPDAYEILRYAAEHITVFADPYQRVFENGSRIDVILDKLDIDTIDIHILDSYRSSPFVAKLASYFIEDDKIGNAYLAGINMPQKIREKPALYIADTYEEQMDKIAEILRLRIIEGDRIGIFTPTKRMMDKIHKELLSKGIETQKAVASYQVKIDFNSNKPVISTYFSAKGLTFDTVIMPNLTKEDFEWMDKKAIKRILFVGISRAMHWVFLSTIKEKELEEFDILRKAHEKGDIEILSTKFKTVRQDSSYSDEFDVL